MLENFLVLKMKGFDAISLSCNRSVTLPKPYSICRALGQVRNPTRTFEQTLVTCVAPYWKNAILVFTYADTDKIGIGTDAPWTDFRMRRKHTVRSSAPDIGHHIYGPLAPSCVHSSRLADVGHTLQGWSICNNFGQVKKPSGILRYARLR